jgi:YfiH family protein
LSEVRYTQFQHYQPFPEVRHGVFMRTGGHSPPPHHSLNTIKRGGDSNENVVRNRQLVLGTLGLLEQPILAIWEVHGANVVTYRVRQDSWRTDWSSLSFFERPWQPAEIHKGDALITNERGVGLVLSFADCVPITFYDPIQKVIGIAHGGWRGTARGIVVATVEAMHAQFGSRPVDIRAGIGPAIGPCCYEVSEMVQQIFLGEQAFDDQPTLDRYREIVRESAAFSLEAVDGQASLRLDLQTTNRQQLLMAGLRPEHIEIMRTCTCCNKDRYFSHRGDEGKTGRFPVVMALAAE